MNNHISLFKETGDKKYIRDFYNKDSYQRIYSRLDPKWKAKYKTLVMVMNLKKTDRVLDVGCASRLLKPFIEKQGASYFGVDIAENFKPDLVCDAEKLDGIADDSFDWIVLSDLLEHVEHPDLVLLAANRVGRNLVAIVPNWYKLERFADALPRDSNDCHLHKMHPREWLNLFYQSRWKVQSVRGFFYVPSIAFYPFKILKLIDLIFRSLPFRLLSWPIDRYLAGLPLIRFLGQELVVVCKK